MLVIVVIFFLMVRRPPKLHRTYTLFPYTALVRSRRAQVAAGAANVTRDGSGAIVASPISGRVTAESVSLGAFVQPETELFRIADPSKVQIEAAVGPIDAQRLAPGDRAIIELPDGRPIDASVRAVTPGIGGE